MVVSVFWRGLKGHPKDIFGEPPFDRFSEPGSLYQLDAWHFEPSLDLFVLAVFLAVSGRFGLRHWNNFFPEDSSGQLSKRDCFALEI